MFATLPMENSSRSDREFYKDCMCKYFRNHMEQHSLNEDNFFQNYCTALKEYMSVLETEFNNEKNLDKGLRSYKAKLNKVNLALKCLFDYNDDPTMGYLRRLLSETHNLCSNTSRHFFMPYGGYLTSEYVSLLEEEKFTETYEGLQLKAFGGL